MRPDKIGFFVEKNIIAKLREKCEVSTDVKHDHKYKLDFLVTQFKELDKAMSLGVQVTTYLNDIRKQTEFLTNIERNIVVDKAIYVEIDEEIGVEDRGAALVYMALVASITQNGFREKKALGVRINRDVSFGFFDLRNVAAQAAGEGGLRGGIVRYFQDAAYGFINELQSDKQWYFRIGDLVDGNLKDNFLLKAEINTNNYLSRPIYVDFDDGGPGFSGKAPRAKNVRLTPLQVVKDLRANDKPAPTVSAQASDQMSAPVMDEVEDAEQPEIGNRLIVD
jgi:hypothetical protein